MTFSLGLTCFLIPHFLFWKIFKLQDSCKNIQQTSIKLTSVHQLITFAIPAPAVPSFLSTHSQMFFSWTFEFVANIKYLSMYFLRTGPFPCTTMISLSYLRNKTLLICLLLVTLLVISQIAYVQISLMVSIPSFVASPLCFGDQEDSGSSSWIIHCTEWSCHFGL